MPDVNQNTKFPKENIVPYWPTK